MQQNKEDREKSEIDEQVRLVTKEINIFLKKFLWMDFELYKFDNFSGLSGVFDEWGGEEIINIKFLEPYFFCCVSLFSYDKGEFIELVEGTDEEYEFRRSYNIPPDCYIFKIIIYEGSFFIASKSIELEVNKNYPQYLSSFGVK